MTPEEAAAKVIRARYGDGKPRFFVQQAVLIASCAAEFGGFLESLIGKASPPANLPGVPVLSEWLPLYLSHRRVIDEVGKVFGLDRGTRLSDVAADWRKFVHTPEPRQARLIRAFTRPKEVARLVRLAIEGLRGVQFPPTDDEVRQILDQETALAEDPEFDNRFGGFMTTPEGQFYFRVWLPCWVIYQDYPPNLFRRARQGCEDSLEKLVRLDKAVAAEPRIAARLHSLTRSADADTRERFLRALSGPPKGRLDTARIKTLLAGLISQLAIAMKCPVTSVEIAQIFGAIHRVRGGDSVLGDPDFLSGIDIGRATRNNRIWPSLPRR